MTDTKYIYRFGNGKAEGNRGHKPLLGGTGAYFNEMSSIDVPGLSRYTITTEA